MKTFPKSHYNPAKPIFYSDTCVKSEKRESVTSAVYWISCIYFAKSTGERKRGRLIETQRSIVVDLMIVIKKYTNDCHRTDSNGKCLLAFYKYEYNAKGEHQVPRYIKNASLDLTCI